MTTAIVWFRKDLRLADNPALAAALEHDRVLPVFIDDTSGLDGRSAGAASKWWLHHSLEGLAAGLARRGSQLVLRTGPPLEAMRALVRETAATHVYWNRRYEPAGAAVDTATKSALADDGLEVETFNASLLFEPWEIRRPDGGPYRVFTAFWKTCLRAGTGHAVAAAPDRLPPPPPAARGPRLEQLGLLPEVPWDSGLRESWSPGEAGALEHLAAFLDTTADTYDKARDRPGQAGTSRLSPHLHFGEVGPRQILAALAARYDGATMDRQGPASFVRELGWREFAHHLLYHFPETVTGPLDPRFAEFPWRTGYAEDLRLWQRGRTGIPFVDAGMRELWHTGWMHNRVRMVVASFLTKNLLIPWQEGARWFWDTLVDADLASNTLGWQWVAGSGADAAPYFRVFNPVLQGEKFDEQGQYVKRWVPELRTLAPRHVHQPWSAPAAEQETVRAAGYPPPMVDLKLSR